MASKNTDNNNLWVYLGIAVLVGGLVGYFLGQSNRPFSRSYINETASMMKNNSSSMMQMGKMMMNGGQMMQEKGEIYNDSEMMQEGKDLEENGQIMQNKVNSMMERGNGMTQMMR